MKHEFLKKFTQNRKDLSWVTSFEIANETRAESVGEVQSGFFNRNEILKMNGFQPADLNKKEAFSLLLDLLEECKTLHNVHCDQIDHENPMMVKWWYVKTTASKELTVETQSEKTTDHVAGEQSKFQKALEAGPCSSSASGSGGLQIKLENPHLAQFKSRLAVLKVGKSSLQRQYDQGKDVSAAVLAKKIDSDMLRFKNAMDLLGEFIEKVRTKIAQFDGFGPETEVQNHMVEMEQLIIEATSHNDGFKLIMKEVRKMLA